ncbi:MAG: ATP-binding protein [Cyanophyceae cyanobacterium]
MGLYQSSFRRLLLSRLLLLSVPVLLTGVYVTYRKARSAFLESARQNLTESAVRRGESIQQSIELLQANLITASNAVVLKLDSPQQQQTFVEQLSQQLPTQLQCVQLTNLQSGELAASTCGEQAIAQPNFSTLWPQEQKQLLTTPDEINVKLLLPPVSAENVSNQSQLELLLSAPVYNLTGQLSYAISVRTALLEKEEVEPGSLQGYPVVINQAGVILAHPYPERVGRHIEQEEDAERLASLIKGAISGRQDFLHLFAFEKDGIELVAGYSSLTSPVTGQPEQQWIILAVTPLADALLPLKELRQALIFTVWGLISASVIATLYIARDLARPLEKLRDYALQIEHLRFTDRVPLNFNTKEFKQLSIAIRDMVERLRAWGEEIVSAWKEAQNANQLKNEFLATTSHELRTPLNGIIGCIRVVKDGYCDSHQEELEFLRQADEAAVHLLGIINDVLDISKIEAGRLSVLMEKVDLDKLLKEVFELQTIPIRQKGLKFDTPKVQEKILVQADPAKLKQVLINIIGNAVKFTESGNISVNVRLEEHSVPVDIPSKNGVSRELDRQEAVLSRSHLGFPSNITHAASGRAAAPPHAILLWSRQPETADGKQSIENGRYRQDSPNSPPPPQAVVTIKDTGIGIDPSQQDKLFRPFVMVDGSTTRKFGGTGLGLAISKNLIELMGGSISLFSEGKGKGTTVEIRLLMSDCSVETPVPSSHNGYQKDEG